MWNWKRNSKFLLWDQMKIWINSEPVKKGSLHNGLSLLFPCWWHPKCITHHWLWLLHAVAPFCLELTCTGTLENSSPFCPQFFLLHLSKQAASVEMIPCSWGKTLNYGGWEWETVKGASNLTKLILLLWSQRILIGKCNFGRSKTIRPELVHEGPETNTHNPCPTWNSPLKSKTKIRYTLNLLIIVHRKSVHFQRKPQDGSIRAGIIHFVFTMCCHSFQILEHNLWWKTYLRHEEWGWPYPWRPGS